MQNIAYFALVFLSTALFVQGAIPNSLRSFFFPAGEVAATKYSNRQPGTQEFDTASVSEKEEDRLSLIAETHRSNDVGDFPNSMTNTPVHKAQCYNEITVTQRQAGRCIRLGRHTPACQSNEYVSINFNECS